ncbi:hypothetical protein ACQPZP_34305 [Spirillospora sp. CA-142024]|uniref:hypothetical protein n=1 Tax=Spirillospora sp. CA-142024 TaxID=3240036 RepID=UPI003D8B5EB3
MSTSASQRAVGGLGNAASVVNSLLFNHTGDFGYCGVFGTGTNGPFTLPTASTLTADQVAALKKVSVSVQVVLNDASPGSAHALPGGGC